MLGLAAWRGYRIADGSAAAVPLLYLAVMGASNFFGNLMSISFIGDFSNVATWTGLPMAARYALSAVGMIVMSFVLFVGGRELTKWAVPGRSRTFVALQVVVLPVLVGTAAIILLNQPVPLDGFATARLGESAFWVFGAAGAFTAARGSRSDHADMSVRWQDGAIAALVVLTVRVMTLGISLSD